MSFSPGSDPDLYKRMSYSEMSLNKNARISIPPSYPGLNSSSNSKMKSRSHHNLSHLPESPEHRMVPFGSQLQSDMTRSQVLVSSHQRASSDTDSILATRQQEGWEIHRQLKLYILYIFTLVFLYFGGVSCCMIYTCLTFFSHSLTLIVSAQFKSSLHYILYIFFRSLTLLQTVFSSHLSCSPSFHVSTLPT